MAKKAVRWDSMDKDSIALDKLILQFEAFNRSEGKTAATVQWYNTGTVWGLAQGFPTGLRLLRCAAVLVILVFVWRTSRRARLALLALGVVLAGALGNLYDNFTVVVEEDPRLNGGVRDFLQFTFWDWSFPAFNVADSCITVGAVCLAIWLLFLDPHGGKAAKPSVEDWS